MTTIHWCGTGLSSGPGLRRLIEGGHKVVVWNRTVEKAQEAVGDLTKDIHAYSLEALTAALEAGDIAISMLTADHHVGIAKACLEKNAHFVSSSYIAPEMRELDAEFRAKGLVSVNEVGLDPGIDHLMAQHGRSAATLPAGAQALATHPRIAGTARLAGFAQVQLVRPGLADMVASLQSAPS